MLHGVLQHLLRPEMMFTINKSSFSTTVNKKIRALNQKILSTITFPHLPSEMAQVDLEGGQCEIINCCAHHKSYSDGIFWGGNCFLRNALANGFNLLLFLVNLLNGVKLLPFLCVLLNIFSCYGLLYFVKYGMQAIISGVMGVFKAL